MASPPPTPSSLVPVQSSEYRFCPVSDPTEWAEDYRPGHFHPVQFGDRFKDGRYRVLRKLGYGSFSTVWLARDEQIGRYVVLKILTADSTTFETESSILEKIAQEDSFDLGKQHIISLQDHFKHSGPNGEHGCLVFEVMGPSTATMVDHLPKDVVSKIGPYRYPMWMARSILRQALLGIGFLHRIGIAHGDLQPGNLLFAATNIQSVEESRLSQEDVDPSSLVPLERLDGKVDLWAPTYLALNQPLTEFMELDTNFIIKITDMGEASFIDNPPKSIVTSASLRSPETIIGEVSTSSQDIWSFGCLMFEFVTGRPLFCIDTFDCDQDETNDDHFLQLFDVLGPIPRDILSQWTRSDVYFNADGENIKSYIGELPEGYDLNEIKEHTLPPLEEFFDREKPAEVSDEESKQIKHVLRWILQFDKTKRPTASELLNDPWFVESIPVICEGRCCGE